MICTYKNFKSPMVEGQIDIYHFLENIRKPIDSVRDKIIQARSLKAKGEDDLYSEMKAQLPCYTLSFVFDQRRRNENITASTGFIYIDIDGCIDIDFSNPYIFASWISLSGNGRGILVKVEDLTQDNFKTNYSLIAKELNINADVEAGKASQFNVNSYDENLYNLVLLYLRLLKIEILLQYTNDNRRQIQFY